MRNRAGLLANKTKRSTKSKAGMRKMLRPLRMDPTRSILLRKAFAVKVRRAFARLRLAIDEEIRKNDALGLGERKLFVNTANVSYFAECERDERGWCLPGTGVAVDVGDDIKRAAKMLAKGARVTLDQPDQVSTLIKRMQKMIQKAVEKGEAAPKFDLCKVSVPGTNLFCQEHIGIPRVEMPQMRGIPRPGSEADKLPRNKVGKVDVGRMFVEHLKAEGIKVHEENVRASHLRASQNEIDGARIAELVTERTADDLRKRPIFVTRDNYVVDGHHHWAALVGKGAKKDKDYKVPVYKIDTDIGTALHMANEYANKIGIQPKSVPKPAGNVSNSAEDAAGPSTNAEDWRFRQNAEKVRAFQGWIRQQLQISVTSRTEEELWKEYIRQGFEKGAGRSFDDAKAVQKATGKVQGLDESKRDFLRSSFRRPVAVEKVKLLAGRAFDDLKGITEDMSVRMSRVLVDDLIAGRGPREVAGRLNREVELAEGRALLVARTEIIRAHAEGQLTALEQLGIEDVGVAVEWSTTGDDRVCDLCEPLQGVVLKIGEARGMLPRHPNCRCAWIPANVGEDQSSQKDTRSSISRAIAKSKERGGDEDEEKQWRWREGAAISRDRPESVVNAVERFSRLLGAIV